MIVLAYVTHTVTIVKSLKSLSRRDAWFKIQNVEMIPNSGNNSGMLFLVMSENIVLKGWD